MSENPDPLPADLFPGGFMEYSCQLCHRYDGQSEAGQNPYLRYYRSGHCLLCPCYSGKKRLEYLNDYLCDFRKCVGKLHSRQPEAKEEKEAI